MNYIRNYTKKEREYQKAKIYNFIQDIQTSVANITELGMLGKLYTLRELTKHNLVYF